MFAGGDCHFYTQIFWVTWVTQVSYCYGLVSAFVRRALCVNIFFSRTISQSWLNLVCIICRVRRQVIVNFLAPTPRGGNFEVKSVNFIYFLRNLIYSAAWLVQTKCTVRAVIPFKLGPNIGPIPNGKKRPFSQFSVEKFPIMLTLLSQDEKKIGKKHNLSYRVIGACRSQSL